MDFDELLVLIDLPPRVLGTEYIFKDLIISYIITSIRFTMFNSTTHFLRCISLVKALD